jgi:hypothetical protein
MLEAHICALQEFRNIRYGTLWHGSWKTGIVEPEETAIARERPINMFPRQRTLDATIEELLETVFSIGSATRLHS